MVGGHVKNMFSAILAIILSFFLRNYDTIISNGIILSEEIFSLNESHMMVFLPNEGNISLWRNHTDVIVEMLPRNNFKSYEYREALLANVESRFVAFVDNNLFTPEKILKAAATLKKTQQRFELYEKPCFIYFCSQKFSPWRAVYYAGSYDVPPTTQIIDTKCLQKSFLKGYSYSNIIKRIMQNQNRIWSLERPMTIEQKFWLNVGLRALPSIKIETPNVERKQIFYTKTFQYDIANEISRTIVQHIATVKRNLEPIVTIVIPFYNVKNIDWFKESLKSVRDQSFHDFDVLIVDDATSDRLSNNYLSILQKAIIDRGHCWNGILPGDPYEDREYSCIPVRFIRHALNLGLAASRNTGVIHAKGKYVLFLDPDDIMAPTMLEKLVLTLHSNPSAAFAYTGVQHFGSFSAIAIDKFHSPRLRQENYIPSAALIRKKVYIQVGGMCSRQRGVMFYEDYDFWCRLVSLGYFGINVPEPLFYYRRHENGENARIIRDSEGLWKRELVANNMYFFGHMTQNEFNDLIKSRWSRTHSSRNESKQPMPCYFPMTKNTILDDTNEEHGKIAKVSFSDITDDTDLFPFHGAHNRSHRSDKNLLYITPWATAGGADLYDLNVLKSYGTIQNSIATVLYGRDISFHENVWNQHFLKHATGGTFTLPHLTSLSEEEDMIIDYFLRSRNIRYVVFRGVEVGYRSVARWNAQGLFRTVKCIDIHHIQNHLARDDWEWRSGKVANLLSERVVVSQDLRRYLIDVVKFGQDSVVNIGWESKNFSSLASLTASQQSAIRVIPPAIINEPDFDRQTISLQTKYKYSKHIRRVLFIGRLDAQKNPFLWLLTAFLVHYKSIVSNSSFRYEFHIIGSGMLEDSSKQFYYYLFGQLRYLMNIDKRLPKPRVLFRKMLPHRRVKYEIASNPNSIILMTSEYEGTPTVLMEAQSIGIPVVWWTTHGKESVGEIADKSGEVNVSYTSFTNLELAQNIAEKVVDCFKSMDDQVKSFQKRGWSEVKALQKSWLRRYHAASNYRNKYDFSVFREKWLELFV